MIVVLPPLQLAAIALALGALGGVSATRMVGFDEMAPPSIPVAQAAIVEDVRAPDEAIGKRQIVRRSHDGLFYVWVRANGKPIRFLVDTGASVVVLTAADAAAIGATPGRYDGRMQTASGGTQMAWTKVHNMSLGGRRIDKLKAAVVRNGPGVSLLGANLLARLGPVRIDGDRMEIG